MNSEEIKDTIFVGGIPYDMTLEEFEEEISTWGNVTKKYLKYHGGWGTVSFDSNSSRNRFLKDKSKHKLWNKLVDVKPYIYNPDKVKNSGPGHLVIGKGQVKMTTETSLKAKAEEVKTNEVKNMSMIEKQMSDLQVSPYFFLCTTNRNFPIRQLKSGKRLTCKSISGVTFKENNCNINALLFTTFNRLKNIP